MFDGERFFHAVGIDAKASPKGKRPVCRACLDWSVRRSHLAGTLGSAIYEKILAEKWARRDAPSRAVIFSASGMEAFTKSFLLA